MRNEAKENIGFFVLALILLVIDLFSKHQANYHLKSLLFEQEIHLLPLSDSLGLSLAHNYERITILGLGQNLSVAMIILLMFFLVFVIYGRSQYQKMLPSKHLFFAKLSIVFLFAGLGNLLEILHHGYATDFIYFLPLNSINERFNIFNTADLFLFTSVFLLLINLLIWFLLELKTEVIEIIKTRKQKQ